MEDINFETIKPDLRKIVQAIVKAVGLDTREYLSAHNYETHNHVKYLRGDFINTNLRDTMFEMELHSFHRAPWEGRLLIDRRNQITYSICSKQTLEGIPKAKNRHIPHYLQTILHVQNVDVKPKFKQMTLPGMEEGITVFEDEDYRNDYENIMGDDLMFGDGYAHLVVVYESKGREVTYVAARLLAPECEISQEWPLMDMLKPDLIDLTAEVDGKPKMKDAHGLVTVKLSLVKAREKQPMQDPLVSAKQQEGEQQA